MTMTPTSFLKETCHITSDSNRSYAVGNGLSFQVKQLAGRLSLCYATLHWHDNGTAGLARASEATCVMKQSIDSRVIDDYFH